ncbi:glycosyltransferase [Rhodococcus sp. NPDC003318]|uniref:glycosyltransferase n=1 Tax=Rhodococcus sp. NPDC003318 TaxID=3364503 RepID=UPI00368B6F2B
MNGAVPVRFAASVAVTGAAIALLNTVTIVRLRPGATVTEPVTVCVPARDEAAALPRLIADLRTQRAVPDLRVLILDDDSTDGTSAAASDAIDGDPRFTVDRRVGEPPDGWVGKPAACAALADLAADRGGALVFLDADVRLEPDALCAAVTCLRDLGVDLLCPWPEQVATSAAERLLQPLLCWSWLSSAPLPIANRSRRPSLAVACGQFLAFDADAYRAVGGHRTVAASVAEDLDLARALRRAGRRTAVATANGLAHCRMYSSAGKLREGHGRWLWTQFGSPAGAAAVLGIGAAAFVVGPAFAAVSGHRRWAALAYGAAVASRLLARGVEAGHRPTAADGVDALAHPVSVLALAALTVDSHVRRRRGSLTWKGRPLRDP